MSKTSSKNDLESKIIQKAWEDESFKKALLENPKAAIQKLLEVNIPADINIKVVEETSKDLYLVLPVNPSQQGASSEAKSGELLPQTLY